MPKLFRWTLSVVCFNTPKTMKNNTLFLLERLADDGVRDVIAPAIKEYCLDSTINGNLASRRRAET